MAAHEEHERSLELRLPKFCQCKLRIVVQNVDFDMILLRFGTGSQLWRLFCDVNLKHTASSIVMYCAYIVRIWYYHETLIYKLGRRPQRLQTIDYASCKEHNQFYSKGGREIHDLENWVTWSGRCRYMLQYLSEHKPPPLAVTESVYEAWPTWPFVCFLWDVRLCQNWKG